MEKLFSFTIVGNDGAHFDRNNIITTVTLYDTRVVVESVVKSGNFICQQIRSVHLLKHMVGVETLIINNGLKENIDVILGLTSPYKIFSAPATEENLAIIKQFLAILERLL